MKLVFVYWGYENPGSLLDLRGYARAAKEMGHEVTVYGPPNPKFALNYSHDLAGADAVVFVFEWTTDLQYGDRLDWSRLVSSVPRSRRVVIDCDGALQRSDQRARRLQPPHRGREHAYMADFCDAWRTRFSSRPRARGARTSARSCSTSTIRPGRHRWISPAKDFSMIYVGHTKFRWHGMSQVLRAVEPVREQVGRVALVGEGWDKQPDWAQWHGDGGQLLRRSRLSAAAAAWKPMPPIPYRPGASPP